MAHMTRFQSRSVSSSIYAESDQREAECGIEIGSVRQNSSSGYVRLAGYVTVAAFGLVGALTMGGFTYKLAGVVLTTFGAMGVASSYQSQAQLTEHSEESKRVIKDCRHAFKVIGECAFKCSEVASSLNKTIEYVTEPEKSLDTLLRDSEELREDIRAMKAKLSEI